MCIPSERLLETGSLRLDRVNLIWKAAMIASVPHRIIGLIDPIDPDQSVAFLGGFRLS